MNWDDIRIFLAVARAGQLLGASKRLGLNHATVGRRLTVLESNLRTRLVERHTNGCVLTSAGVEFLERAERMEQEMTSARAAIHKDDEEIAGTVRIGASDGFGSVFLAPRLRPLLDKYPQLKIELVPVPQSFSLSRREADIAITIGQPEHGRVVVRKLVDYSLSLFASKQYLEQHGSPKTIDDLGHHRLVGYVDDLIFSPNLHYKTEFSKTWTSQFECTTTVGQMEAVSAGLGIGILHDFLVQPHHQLTRILRKQSITRSYWLVFHESARHIRRVKIVSDFIHKITVGQKQNFYISA